MSPPHPQSPLFYISSPGNDKPAHTGIDLYSRFFLAGAVCCGVTHGSMTPVDVVKTRIQLEPEVYNRGMIAGFGQVVQKEGPHALLTGFGPTAAGYFLQGGFKFGGYEFWKKTLVNVVGFERASDYRDMIYLTASGIAEFFADIALCPLEATRIRLVSQPDFAPGLAKGFTRLLREEGVLNGFYSGFGPILFKQVPYTMAKFVVFERSTEAILRALPTPKEELTASNMTCINLSAGVIAGVAAAIVSHPADTLLSMINKERGKQGESIIKRLVTLAQKVGPRGLFVGLGPRILMVGALTSGQFAIYGDIKRMLGASGGVEIHKVGSKEETPH